MYLGSCMLNGHNGEHAGSHSECVFFFFFCIIYCWDKWHDILLVEPFYDSAIPIMFFNINRSTMTARLRALIKPPAAMTAEQHPLLHCGGGEMIGWRKAFAPSVSDAVVWKSIKTQGSSDPLVLPKVGGLTSGTHIYQTLSCWYTRNMYIGKADLTWLCIV